MAFAKDTLIETPGGARGISEITVGSTTLVWTPQGTKSQTVKFISGSDEGQELNMLYLEHGDHHLIVTLDQPIMLSDHTVKRGYNLDPARDGLLGANGEVILNYTLRVVKYNKGCWNLTFDTEADKGSFIVANGIVCGDFTVEISRE